MAELDAEEPPEEEEMEDEGEEEFEERTMTALREKYEEQTDTISSVQVRAISQFLKFIQAFFMNKSTTCTCVYSSQSTCRACSVLVISETLVKMCMYKYMECTVTILVRWQMINNFKYIIPNFVDVYNSQLLQILEPCSFMFVHVYTVFKCACTVHVQ